MVTLLSVSGLRESVRERVCVWMRVCERECVCERERERVLRVRSGAAPGRSRTFSLLIFGLVDRLRVGWPLVRSHGERRCSILGQTQSRISPSILEYTKIQTYVFFFDRV